jgi:AcrR family transcriptional regulator
MRDLERTREKILSAARTEFCAKGLAGARTAAIARRAGVNKRMLFYCFGSKEELYNEILRRKSAESARFLESVSDEVGAALVQWDGNCREDPDWVRLLEWEALESGAGPVVIEETRRRLFKAALAKLRRAQEKGNVSLGLDLTQLFLSLVAVTVFPYAFPQLVRLISGKEPSDADFVARRSEFLHWLGERLALAETGVQAAPSNRRPNARVESGIRRSAR